MSIHREGSTLKAKVQAMFDKSDVEKLHDLDNNTVDHGGKVAAQKNADAIRSALKDQIATGRVGSLTVDPQYLDFEALECKSPVAFQFKTVERICHPIPDKSASEPTAKETLLSFFDLSETRLYIVLGLIAALVLIALIQAFCTIWKTSRKSKSTKVSCYKNLNSIKWVSIQICTAQRNISSPLS